MLCLIARHGHSINVGEQGITRDYERPLSVSGIKQITQMGKGLKQTGVKPAIIIASPFKRTIETAKIFANILNGDDLIVTSSFLESGARFEDYNEAFNELGLWEKYNDKAVMFVGHAPDVGKVCDVLTSMKGFAFDTGNVAQIVMESPGSAGLLTGFWSPALFSNL